MWEQVYEMLRGTVGLTLIVLGVSFCLEPAALAVRRALGIMFAAVGLLFGISALDPIIHFPLFLGDTLVVVLTFVVGQALYEIVRFILGGERDARVRRSLYLAGAVWTLALVALPVLDWLWGLQPVRSSVEDAVPMGPFRAFVSVALYVWPVAIALLGLVLSRWRLTDLPPGSAGRRHMMVSLGAVSLVLGAALSAVLLDSQVLYRLAHSLLELGMIAWYFHLVRHPQSFTELRSEIQGGHERRNAVDPAEQALVGGRLAELVRDGRLLTQPGTDLAAVAEAIRVPAYRLSRYFNAGLGTSFPAWLNSVRIERACALMQANPERTILDVSLEAGYATKAVFNTQFQRIMGMSPSEYRKRFERRGRDSAEG